MVDLNNINHEATYWSCVAITEEESHELFPPEPRPCKIFDSLIVDQCFIIPLNAQGEPLTTNFEYLSGGPVMIKVNAKEVFETLEQATKYHKKLCIDKAGDYASRAARLIGYAHPVASLFDICHIIAEAGKLAKNTDFYQDLIAAAPDKPTIVSSVSK